MTAPGIYGSCSITTGFDRRNDEPPEVYLQPLKGIHRIYYLTDYSQTTSLSEKDVNQYLDDYYDERGWDKDTSQPTANKLKELGLENF